MEKNDVVKSVQANGTFDFNGKTFYKYEVEMENGDVGEYNSISATQSNFVEGAQVDYIYDTSKPKFPKIKPVYNFKASPSRDGNFNNVQKAQRGDDVQKMIVKQSCLKAAVEALNKNAKTTDILETANVFVDWVMNDTMPETKTKKKSKKETTDLPF
tara:strand:- start:659 stop:1129 length:471 start_codon:yes stop_codon:yes gene_type:complete